MRKAAKSLLLLGARRAYNAWTEMCAEAQERRARMRGALNSLLQLGSRRALNAWRAMAAEVGAARRKAAGAARTFGPEGRMQRAAWNSWKELVQERLLMKRAGMSMMLQGQRKCLNGWKEMVEAAAAKKQAMLKVAAAIRMRGSRMAWNAWTELAAEMAAAKFKAAGAARSFSPEGRAQRAAWNSWRELAQERALMKRAGASMMLQGQRKCLNAWTEMVEAAAAKKQAMLKVAAAIRMRGSRMAWNAWTELAAEMAAAKFKAAGAARSFSPEGRAQRAAWNSWKELVQEWLLMKRAGASMMLQGQRKCLNAWTEMVAAAAAKKQAMLKVAAAIRMRGSRMAWNAWMELAAEMAAAKLQAAGALRSLRPEGRKMRMALNSWVELLEDVRARKAHLMQTCGAAFRYGDQRRALNTWHASLAQRRALEAAILPLVRRMVQCAFGCWSRRTGCNSRGRRRHPEAAQDAAAVIVRRCWMRRELDRAWRVLRELAEHQRWRRTEAATAEYVDALKAEQSDILSAMSAEQAALKAEQSAAVAEAQRAAAQALDDTAALRDAYEEHMHAKGQWQARESDEVHALRAENGGLAAQVEEMREGILAMQERLEALLVAAYDEIRADLSGDAARRGKLEVLAIVSRAIVSSAIVSRRGVASLRCIARRSRP